MTVIDLLRERAAREVPRYLDAFETGSSLVEEIVFSSDAVARVGAHELRREICRRGLDCSVTRRGSSVFVRDHAYRDDVEHALALLLSALMRRAHGGDRGRSPAEAG
jgi:hypothetical protein